MCGQEGLRGDGDFGAAGGGGVVDAVGCVVRGDGDERGFGGEVEPALFGFDVADEFGVVFSSGPREAGADGGDADSFVAEFGVQTFGESDESELCGGVRQQVRHRKFAADAGNVRDGCAARPSRKRCLFSEMGQRGPGGVERGEEGDLQRALEGFGCLGFDGADLDCAGIVDEHVDATETGDGLGDEATAFAGFGEIGRDQMEVFGPEVRMLGEQRGLGALEFLAIARGEDEANWTLCEPLGDGKAEAA